MDSKSASLAAPEPDSLNFAATLDNARFDKVTGNGFTMDKYNLTKEGENLVLVSSDVINHLLNTVPLCIAEVRKSDQSRSTLAETTSADASDPVSQAVTTDQTLEGDPVDLVDIVPPDPASLPVVSIADLYTRSMLKCLAGYPLYEPQPLSELSTEYLLNGVSVGDVGFVREDGTFDSLFNIYPSKNALINPSTLPDGFSLETSECSATRVMRSLPRETRFFKSPITRTNSGEYICEESEGAILELPEGAIEEEATNLRPFENLAARFGVEWYEYTMTRGRKISNGSLYLITSFTKCTQWGIAVLDRHCAPGQGLSFGKKRSFPFGKSKYRWNGSRVFHTKISDSSQRNAPNQCVFLRGYKIMVREDIFDSLCNDQPRRSDLATPSSSFQVGSGNMTQQWTTSIPTSKTRSGGSVWSPTTMSTMAKSDEVVLHANFIPSLIHPSDLVNAALLSQNPNAKVALTHDDVWCNLLRDNFPKLNYARLMNIVRSYTNTVDEYDCVSLQKEATPTRLIRAARPQTKSWTRISDSTNVLDESNCPLRGSENATFFLTLPGEIVERIFFLLDTDSMLTCSLVNRRFNEIIQSSKALQYFLACKAAGVIDNPRSPLTYAERLKALEKREEAWRKLKPVFEMTIKVDHQPSLTSIYALTGGAYFLDDKNLLDLHYCPLPSSPQDNPHWIRIPPHGLEEGTPAILFNFDLSEYENDLMISVISSVIGNPDTQRHSIDLVLLKFSTGEYHPLARDPRIHVQRSPSARPSIIPRIVGDNLAVLVYSRYGSFRDKLFVFDWKTGHRRLEHEALQNAYSDVVFISPELLLVPNLILSHFEVWHLPPYHPNANPPVQILSLKIPAVSPNYSLYEISCSGLPNPFLHSLPYFPQRPFFSSPKNSIIIANLRLRPVKGTRGVSYTLIMHRRALLDTIQTWTSPSLLEQQSHLPIWLTNAATVHKIADPYDGSVRFNSISNLLRILHSRSPTRPRDSPDFATSPTSSTSRITADSDSSSISSVSSTASSTSTYIFRQVQWADWGPHISRFFPVCEAQAQLIGTSSGQRCAFAVRSQHESRKLKVSVADFNPYNFRRHVERMTRLRGEGEDNGNDEHVKVEESGILDHKGVFAEEVHMGLKCVVYDAPDEYEFDNLLMDEERLVGLKLNRSGQDESIKVLYIG